MCHKTLPHLAAFGNLRLISKVSLRPCVVTILLFFLSSDETLWFLSLEHSRKAVQCPVLSPVASCQGSLRWSFIKTTGSVVWGKTALLFLFFLRTQSRLYIDRIFSFKVKVLFLKHGTIPENYCAHSTNKKPSYSIFRQCSIGKQAPLTDVVSTLDGSTLAKGSVYKEALKTAVFSDTAVSKRSVWDGDTR